MKRNDDGYVLPLVLVVLTVLALVASSVLSASLRNLQVQHKAADRMQEKYIAEGEIEKVVAKLLDENSYKGTEKAPDPLPGEEENQPSTPETDTESSSGADTTPDTGDQTGMEKPDEEMCKAIQNKIITLCGNLFVNSNENTWVAVKVDQKDIFTYTFRLKAAAGDREISCKVELKGSMESKETEENGEKKTTYEAKELSLVYKEYQIGGAGA